MSTDSPEEPATVPRHPIGVVSRRTGLKQDLIRAWERRYGAVSPGRSDTRRRFYSDADVERLRLLRRVVETGRGIGQVAGLPNEALEELLAGEPAAAALAPAPPAAAADGIDEEAGELLERCLSAARRLAARDLELELERASVAMSRPHLLERLVAPLLHRIGEQWHAGALRPIHEHLASSAIRSFLGGLRDSFHPEATAPGLVVTTPARQVHELGALLAAATAAGEGWSVLYLGPDLPPEEIAAAALQSGARAVALSLIYPPDDPLVPDDLRRLRRLLGPGVALLAGGRSASSYAAALEEAGAVTVTDLAGLRRRLGELRAGVGDGENLDKR